MRKVSPFILQYESLLRRDPKSKVFAALAESYREAGDLIRAEKVARHGLKYNLDYSSGYLVLGRILFDLERFADSVAPLLEATKLSPQNLLAHQTLADAYLHLGDHRQALRFFKLVLFMNPTGEKAKKAVAQLESLSATDFGEDLFALKSLKPTDPIAPPVAVSGSAVERAGPVSSSPNFSDEHLVRSLSLLDAYIVRNEIFAARTLYANLEAQFGNHPELLRRTSMVMAPEVPTALTPLPPRKDVLREEKVRILKEALKNIQNYRKQHIDELGL